MSPSLLLPLGRAVLFLAVSALASAGPLLAQAPPGPPTASSLADLDAVVMRELERWKVPGVALAIVKDGRVVLAKGWGYRDLDKKLPVTARTRFAIASDTKSFTAASLALLVDDGKLEWDQPVRRYLPEFQLRDPVASERITPRDLLCHNSGLPRHDMVWYGAKLPLVEIVRRLRFLEPSKDFRVAFQYQNMMFVTAGVLAGRVAGTTWDKLAAQRLLAPLEMRRTNFAPGALEAADDDFSLGYLKESKEQGGRVRAMPFFRGDVEPSPDGAMYSCAEDMAHWIAMKLNGGKWNGRSVLSAAQVALMQAPAMPDPSAGLDPELGDTAYALGVDVTTYRGHRWVFHGGNIDGFSSNVTHLPDDRAGVVVLTNLNQAKLARDVFAYLVTDRVLGLPPIDWGARLKERQETTEAAEEDAKKKQLTPRKPGTRPAHPLEEYTAEYEHPAYGIAEIARAGDGLELRFHGYKLPLNHFHFETWETPPADGNPLEKTRVMFQTGWSGEVERLAIPFEPEVADITFARRPDAVMRQPAFLAPLAGAYELGPLTVTVAARGSDTLAMTIPGQGTYDLFPRRGTTFNVKGLSGTSVEFRRDAAGAVFEMVFYNPDGTQTAKRKP